MNLEASANCARVFAFANVDRHDAVSVVGRNRTSFGPYYLCRAMQECFVDFRRELLRLPLDEIRRIGHVSIEDSRVYIYCIIAEFQAFVARYNGAVTFCPRCSEDFRDLLLYFFL